MPHRSKRHCQRSWSFVVAGGVAISLTIRLVEFRPLPKEIPCQGK